MAKQASGDAEAARRSADAALQSRELHWSAELQRARMEADARCSLQAEELRQRHTAAIAAETAAKRAVEAGLAAAKKDVISAFKLHDAVVSEWRTKLASCEASLQLAQQQLVDAEAMKTAETDAYLAAIADFKSLYERERELRASDAAAAATNAAAQTEQVHDTLCCPLTRRWVGGGWLSRDAYGGVLSPINR